MTIVCVCWFELRKLNYNARKEQQKRRKTMQRPCTYSSLMATVQMLRRAKQRCWSGLRLMGKNPCHIQALVNMQWMWHLITTIAALPELKACFRLYRYYLSSILSHIFGVFPNIRHFRSSRAFDVCVAVHHWYNNINSQLEAKITNFIDDYNMFRAIISPTLRSTILCLQLVV